jgi:hypothetical protein
MLRLLLIVALLVLPTRAATKYIKADAAGSANGTSWANAWTNFNQATGLAAGDMIYISGGASGLTYSGAGFNPDGIGSVASPLTVKKSQEVGHTGLVTIDGANISGNLNNFVFDGANDDNYYTNITSTPSVLTITNNIGIKFRAYNAFNHSTATLDNFRLKWVEVTHGVVATNYGTANRGPDFLEEANGVRINLASPYTLGTNNVVEYCYIHDISTDAINCVQSAGPNQYDKFIVRYSYITKIGDDPLEVGGDGWTVDSCIISDNWRIDGHGDGIQSLGSYMRFRNNIVWNLHNSWVRAQSYYTEGAVTRDIQIIGNFLYDTNTPAYAGAEALSLLTYGNYVTPVTNLYWSNYWVLNNTIVHSPTARAPMTMTKRVNFTNIYTAGMVWGNNIIQNNETSIGINGGITYGTNTLEFDHNIVSGPFLSLGVYSSYASVIELNAATPWTHNKTNLAIFSDTNAVPMDLRLDSSDTAAKNAGKDYSAITELIGWETDLYGNSRTADGTVDIGAAEYVTEGFTYTPPDGVTNGLLVLLCFDEEWTTNTYVTDFSGQGNHAYMFGNPTNAPTYTNAPLRVATSTTPGRTGDTGYAGEFDWFNDGYGEYGKSGRYLAITNQADFEGLGAMTVMCWARYYAPHPTLDFSSDGNAVLVSGSIAQGTLGSWAMGRYNFNLVANETRMVIVTNSPTGQGKFGVPENGYEGNTTNWAHYAFTFDNGTLVTYFNGSPYATNTVAPTTLTLSQSPSRPYDWIGIGANPHVGSPMLEDETGNDYPNNGWMNGVIDDVRIYSRALVAGEVEAIYSGDAYDPGEPPPPSATRIIRANTARVGTIRKP